MLVTGRTVVTRFTMESILKIGYPCGCHYSPVESETYTIWFDVVDPNDFSRRISRIHAKCNNCNQSACFDVSDRWMTENDVSDL